MGARPTPPRGRIPLHSDTEVAYGSRTSLVLPHGRPPGAAWPGRASRRTAASGRHEHRATPTDVAGCLATTLYRRRKEPRSPPIRLQQPQPHLADGRIGGDRMPQAADRDLAGDRHGGRVDQFADAGADEGDAPQDLVLEVDDHAGAAPVTVAVQTRAGDRGELDVDGPDPVAGLFGLRE